MFTRFERMVALRYLRSRRKEGFISVVVLFSTLGIAIGVAALIIVMAVMNGFRAELIERILGISSHMSVTYYHKHVDDYESLQQKLLAIPGVVDTLPIIERQVLASGKETHAGARVRGIRPEDLANRDLIANRIVYGDFSDYQPGNGVLIGIRMAERMGLMPGDTIRLISPQTTDVFLATIPRLKDYTIVGVFDVGMFEYDSATIFMPLSDAQTFFKLGNNVHAVELFLENFEAVEQMRARVMQQLTPDHRLIDWKQANGEYVQSLDVERSAMFLILALIMCVAGFMILSGMWMLVLNKGKEIAILRTMGATRTSIMHIFLSCGLIIGVVGTTLGFILGVSFAANIQEIRVFLETNFDTELFPAAVYFLTHVPSKIVASDVIRTVSLALIISVLATIFPARRAAKMPPAEALRYE